MNLHAICTGSDRNARRIGRPSSTLSFAATALLITICTPTSVRAQAGPGMKVGSNVHISVEHANDGVSESWISADPTDSHRLLACAIVYPTGENRRYTAVYLSTDGGLSWRSTLNTKRYDDTADPACTLGPDGTANYVALSLTPQSGAEVPVYRSVDGGATWRQEATIDVRGSGIDRESIVADATGGPYHGHVYITGETGVHELDKAHSSRNGLGVWTSTDGGATFKGPSLRASPNRRYTLGLGNSVVLKDGTLLTLFGENVNPDSLGSPSAASAGHPNAIIEVAASTDGGQTYEPAVKIADKYMNAVIPAAWTPSLAADPGSISFGANVYATWTDYRSGHAQILLSRSTDKGKSWSAPRVINDLFPDTSEVAGANVFMPNVAVNRDGAVLVTWYDRHTTPGNMGWYIRARLSLDGGDTWLPSTVVSSAMNINRAEGKHTVYTDVSGGGAREYWKHGGAIKLQVHIQPHEFWAADYSGIAVDADGVFHALWTDNRTGMPQLWTAPITVTGAVSRNGDPSLAQLTDVSSKVTFEVVGTSLDQKTGTVSMTARLVNTSADTLRAPFAVRALTVSSQVADSAKATKAANGVTGTGAVWDFTAGTPGGVLLPHGTSGSQSMTFALTGWRPLYGDGHVRTLLVDMPVVVLAKMSR
jgi:hypothetical protein